MSTSTRSAPSGTPISSASTPDWASPDVDQRIIDCYLADDGLDLRTLASTGVSETLIRDRARVLGLTKEFIKKCRLGQSRPAMRRCIKCDDRFLSSGVNNRLCRRCPPR